MFNYFSQKFLWSSFVCVLAISLIFGVENIKAQTDDNLCVNEEPAAVSNQITATGVRIDPTFAPDILTTTGRYEYHQTAVVLPDDKIVIIRQSSSDVNNPVYKLTRLDPDGTLDKVFDVVVNRYDSKFIRQADGKILVFGNGILVNGVNLGGLVRLNTDGTLDTSFDASRFPSTYNGAVQSDGKIIVEKIINSGNTSNFEILRLNSDGSNDNSFSPYTANSGIDVIKLQPNGKILLGFYYQQQQIVRLNQNGTKDTTFSDNLPTAPNPSTSNTSSIIVQANGKIIIGGDYGVIRLNNDGTLDTDFSAQNQYSRFTVKAMLEQPDGKILIGGSPYYFSSSGSVIKERISRINADGTLDTSFDADSFELYGTNGLSSVNPLGIQSNGRIIVSGYIDQQIISRSGLFALLQSGAIDSSFGTYNVKLAGKMTFLANAPDGKFFISGVFEQVGGVMRQTLAKMNLNGTVDTSFEISPRITGTVSAMAFQADGKILIGGKLRLDDVGGYLVLRINPNGELDNSFVPGTIETNNYSEVRGIAVQPDGKIIVGGRFFNYNNSHRDRFLRLNADGTVDENFNIRSPYESNSYFISAILVQPDGKIVVSGVLTDGVITKNNSRLNFDGSFDLSFNVPESAGKIIAVAPDGKFLAEAFVPGMCVSFKKITRLNSDGSLDNSFAATSSACCSGSGRIYFLNNGQILYFGYSPTIIKKDGGIEAAFLPIRDGFLLSDGSLVADSSNGTLIRYIFDFTPDYDFDGDGKSDVSLFRPFAGAWYVLKSSDNSSFGIRFGQNGDIITPADFDGDGKTDFAVFRPSDGAWYRLDSSSGTFTASSFGQSGDVPLSGDFDGDGRADVNVFRPSNGAWYRLNSSNNSFFGINFGQNGDKPLIADFDGDGRSDITVFRPSDGAFYSLNSSNGEFKAVQFGFGTDIPTPADFDGDGKTDIAVYRPSNGAWYRFNSSNNQFYGEIFGTAEDKPVPADYDGDGKADIAVYRLSTGSWYIQNSTVGFTATTYGANSDLPAPLSFVR